MSFQVEVRIELKDSDTGKVVTWDSDTFYCEGDRIAAQAMFDRICDGAGRSAVTAPAPARKAGINEPCKLACADCETYCDCAAPRTSPPKDGEA